MIKHGIISFPCPVRMVDYCNNQGRETLWQSVRLQLHPLRVLVVVATRTFIKLLISKIAISDIEAQRLHGRLLCSRPERRTFIGGFRGLSCRFWSHFGSSGTDGVVHKSESVRNEAKVGCTLRVFRWLDYQSQPFFFVNKTVLRY